MSILNDPDHLIRERLAELLAKAEYEGGWAMYAIYCGGFAGSDFDELNIAVERLYRANEEVHRIANKLALRYDVGEDYWNEDN
jgi:hypothetical protein